MFASKPIICSFDGYQSMINEANCGSFVNYNDSYALVNKIIEFSNYSKPYIELMGARGKEYLLNHRKFEILAKAYLNEIYKC